MPDARSHSSEWKATGAVGLSAHQRLNELVDQAAAHLPRWVVGTDPEIASRYDWRGIPAETQVHCGQEHLCHLVQQDDVDVVVAAIVGSAGLAGIWAAVEAGKTVALANKETLVIAGPLVMDLANRRGSTILPIDSEHSAVFQCLRAGIDRT